MGDYPCWYHQCFGDVATKCHQPLPGVKWPGHVLAAMSFWPGTKSPVLCNGLFLCSRFSRRHWCGGEHISIIKHWMPMSSSRLTLQEVNSTPIVTYGNRSLTLDLGFRCTFCWVFILPMLRDPSSVLLQSWCTAPHSVYLGNFLTL